MSNFTFTQPVSMQVNQEQFDSLKPKLEALGYEVICPSYVKANFCCVLATNFTRNNAFSNVTKECTISTTHHFIDHYNPELFLAIAAMTDAEYGIAGEHWVYKGATNRDFKDGRIYVAVKDISLKEAFIGNDGDLTGNAPFNKRVFRRATLPEIISHYTKTKTDMSTDTRNVQLSLEQAKALYEGNKEQYGWLLTTFPELEQPKRITWHGLLPIRGFYIGINSQINEVYLGRAMSESNTYRTEAQARGALAQAMITQLLPVYNGSDWVADWTIQSAMKYSIALRACMWDVIGTKIDLATILTFKDKSTAERFLTEQSELLEQYKGLFIEPKNS